MRYNIYLTSIAERDIMRAANHVEFVLKNPIAAEHLLDVTTEKINALADMPHKFHLIDDSMLADLGVRYTIVNNYLAFYVIDENKKLVIVLRFLYQKSNWITILHNDLSE